MSVYVGPVVMAQMTADTPGELLDMGDRLRVEVSEVSVRLCIRTRALAVNMGAIELSRREYAQKLHEIAANGRGLGPKYTQIDR